MPAVTTFSPTGDAYLDGLLGGEKWGVSSFTYSFPTSSSVYVSGYGSGEPTNGFEALNATQQGAIRATLNMYSAVANVTFREISESTSGEADFRFAESDAPSTAWAYYPYAGTEGGDVWFNRSAGYYNSPLKGNYAYATMLHEVGHALGLKHPHEVDGSFGALPTARDSVEYTVMSYRSYVGASTTSGYVNETWGYPQSLMMYDIAAIQQLYGANYNTNSGNTTYAWSPSNGELTINGVRQGAPGGNRIFQTVWDGNGVDTYDFSAYGTSLKVDLQPGGWTTTSSTQLAYLGGGKYAVGNVANALLYGGDVRSLIENAVGGSGADTLTGNQAANRLTGNAGADTLNGLAGDDTLVGGGGNDYFSGGDGFDTAVFSGASTDYSWTQNSNGTWTIVDKRTGSPDGTDTLASIESLQFSNQTLALGAQPTTPTKSAPVVSGLTNKSGSEGQGIVVTGKVSDADGAVAGRTVTINWGNGTTSSATVQTDGTFSATRSYGDQGTYTISASMTDADGLSGSANATASITNVAPVVTGPANASGTAGQTTTITGKVTDLGVGDLPTGSVVNINWGNGATSTATIQADGTYSASRSYTTAGTYSIVVSATDKDGATGSATTTASIASGTTTGSPTPTPTTGLNLVGTSANETLTGGSGNDVLEGKGGADKLIGGGGSDTASYASATSGVTVQLANPSNNSGEAAGDTFDSIENVLGSAYADTLVGDAGANRVQGGAGDDKLKGLGGNDVLDGGAGKDTAAYGSGNSTDYSWTKNADGSWTVVDKRAGSPEGTDTLINVEVLKFSDKSVTLSTTAGNTLASGSTAPGPETPENLPAPVAQSDGFDFRFLAERVTQTPSLPSFDSFKVADVAWGSLVAKVLTDAPLGIVHPELQQDSPLKAILEGLNSHSHSSWQS